MGKNVPKNQSLVLTRYIYRLTYSKKGRAKFISHLDLMRTMQRAFKRAKLPVWYTQGRQKACHLEAGGEDGLKVGEKGSPWMSGSVQLLSRV